MVMAVTLKRFEFKPDDIYIFVFMSGYGMIGDAKIPES